MAKEITFELTNEQFESVEKIAKQKGLSVSAFCSFVICSAVIKNGSSKSENESFSNWAREDQLKAGGANPLYKMYASDLYRYYLNWCGRNDQEPCSVTMFGRCMQGTSVPKHRDNLGVYYYASTWTLENEIECARMGLQTV